MLTTRPGYFFELFDKTAISDWRIGAALDKACAETLRRMAARKTLLTRARLVSQLQLKLTSGFRVGIAELLVRRAAFARVFAPDLARNDSFGLSGDAYNERPGERIEAAICSTPEFDFLEKGRVVCSISVRALLKFTRKVGATPHQDGSILVLGTEPWISDFSLSLRDSAASPWACFYEWKGRSILLPDRIGTNPE